MVCALFISTFAPAAKSHIRSSPQSWVIETDQSCGHYLTFEVLVRTGPLRKDKVYATGGFDVSL